MNIVGQNLLNGLTDRNANRLMGHLKTSEKVDETIFLTIIS